MKKFLLLRSNKQSGPYSAEELQQMGLKAYDLIWVEGKSAAWRYPGEIEELKSFAPAVEEQPYDRFYKKQSEPEQKTQEASVPETPVTASPTLQSQPLPEKPIRKEKEYKRVFVTLPSGATAAQTPVQKPIAEPEKSLQYQPPVQNPPTEKKESYYQESLPAESLYDQKKEVVPKPTNSKASSYKAISRESETSRPEEIYYPPKRSFSKRIGSIAAIVIGMVSLISLGIVIGLYINRRDGVSMVKKVETVPDQQAVIPVNKISEPESESTNNSYDQHTLLIDSSKIDEPVKPIKKSTLPPAKKPEVVVDTNQQNLATKQPVQQDPGLTDEGSTDKKPAPKPEVPNLEKMIAVTNNNYEVGPFGGISKLALTVKNTSEYDLNLVVVQLEYLKANKEVFKTENLYFRDVAANSSLTLDAPRSNRGNKINYKVTLINSKDHLFHAGN